MIRNLIEDVDDIEALCETFDILDYMDDRWDNVSVQYMPSSKTSILSLYPLGIKMASHEVYFEIELHIREDKVPIVFFLKNGNSNFSASVSADTVNKLFSYLEDRYGKTITELSFGLFEYVSPLKFDVYGSIYGSHTNIQYDYEAKYYPDTNLEYCIKHKKVKFCAPLSGKVKYLRFDHSNAFAKVSPDVTRFDNGEKKDWHYKADVQKFFMMLEDQYGDSLETISKGLFSYHDKEDTTNFSSIIKQLNKMQLNSSFPTFTTPVTKMYPHIIDYTDILSKVQKTGQEQRFIMEKLRANEEFGRFSVSFDVDSMIQSVDE